MNVSNYPRIALICAAIAYEKSDKTPYYIERLSLMCIIHHHVREPLTFFLTYNKIKSIDRRDLL